MEHQTVGIDNAELKHSLIDNSVTTGGTTNNYYGNASDRICSSIDKTETNEISFKEALDIASRMMPTDRVVAHFDAKQGSEEYLPLLIGELTTVLYDLAGEICKAYPERKASYDGH